VIDLAARLDVDPGIVKVVRVITDEFPVQNLGCPLPDKQNPDFVQPAFVTGREIVLAVNDQRYIYRAYGNAVIFCEEKS
jgi:hypothetical protein